MSSFSPVTWVLARQAAVGAVGDAIASLGEGMHFKGVVATPGDLPSTHNDGDVWIVEDLSPSTPGNQGGKAVWFNSQWNYFDQQPTKLSELENDTQYISTKQNSSNKYIDNIHVDGSGSPSSNAHEYVITDVQLKRNVADSYVPKLGEPIFEKSGSTYRLKIGDGSTNYASLPYIGADFVPDVDNKSVAILGTNLQVYGFNSALNGTVPRKLNNKLEWIKLTDVLKFTAGAGIKITETTVSNVTTEKFDVLYDNVTVKIDSNNRLSVPIDNDTIKLSSGKLAAKKTVAGTGVKVITNSNNEYVVSTTYKPGDNINFTTGTDGSITINSTASGGGGVGVIRAGDGIKVSSSGNIVTVSGDYQAGDYININKNTAGKLEISVDPTAVSNTYRPIELNGREVLSDSAASGYFNIQSSTDVPTGIRISGARDLHGYSAELQIANDGILQANEIGTPHRALATLAGRLVSLHCGNADFDNIYQH